jgi:hypothetical protein
MDVKSACRTAGVEAPKRQPLHPIDFPVDPSKKQS